MIATFGDDYIATIADGAVRQVDGTWSFVEHVLANEVRELRATVARLECTRSTARLMADVIVLLRDELPVGSDGRRWAEDALKAYQDGFGN